MRKHFLTGERTTIEDWMKEAIHRSEEEMEKVRKIKLWDDSKWVLFPDAGSYQDTDLTAEYTRGSASALWLKLKPGEGFDPHQHPNACHIMTVYRGAADILWKSNSDGKIYSLTMHVGDRPYAITPDEKHAVVANRGVEAIILVINTPAEDINRHDYAIPVHEH